MLIIGSHVSFKKDDQLLGSVKESLKYGSNTFMFYTGAPQNTNRASIDDACTYEAIKLMKENGINNSNLIVHAPYIINLANTKKIEQYNFSIRFLIEECERCEELFVNKMVLHPGSHVGVGVEEGLNAISKALNKVLETTSITILLETMAGKGTELGTSFEQLKEIIDNIDKNEQIGICLDTCHLSDAGYDLSDFDSVLDDLERLDLLKRVKCIHINDSKNIRGSHKDRHANIGYGEIGFDNLIKIIYNERLDNIPKILETPYIEEYAPYKYELEMIRNKKFNENLFEEVKSL